MTGLFGRQGAVGVKICGINDRPGLDSACQHGADWVGFVFHPRSPRFVTPAQAAELSRQAPSVANGGPARVALVVEPDDALLADILATLAPDIIQAYAGPARIREIRALTQRPVWQAIGIERAEERPQEAAGDALLIEARAPRDATRPGGNGTALDWSILQGWQAPCPWMLAGGLTPENVAQAIAQSGASAVDVSSGVEARPGQKSPDLIAKFIKVAKACSKPLASRP